MTNAPHPKDHVLDEHLGKQLVTGLKQLKMNIELLHKTHATRGLNLDAPYTRNTENALKLAYVDEALKGLES